MIEAKEIFSATDYHSTSGALALKEKINSP